MSDGCLPFTVPSVKLNHRHIVVVGCSKRIGFFLTERLLEMGCKVSGLYRTSSIELESLQQKYPDTLNTFEFDLEQSDTSLSLATEVVRKTGPVSALISVASQFFKTPLGQVSSEAWDQLFDTNVKGHFFLTQAFVPHLAHPSHLIYLVDIFAEKPLRGYLAYSAAKAALLNLAMNLAHELAPNTQVNSVSPGPVLLPENFSEEEKKLHASRTLLGRTGSPEDIWNAVYFLLSHSYITGENICVDGGSSLL